MTITVESFRKDIRTKGFFQEAVIRREEAYSRFTHFTGKYSVLAPKKSAGDEKASMPEYVTIIFHTIPDHSNQSGKPYEVRFKTEEVSDKWLDCIRKKHHS